jgi:LPS-assembly lipoprotein
MRRKILAVLIPLLALLPAACGFHLRGNVEYPAAMAVTYIETTDRYTPFYRGLRATLRESGVQVTDDPTAAGAVLRILHDESGQRVLTMSARNTPEEYDVYYVVRYALQIGGSEAISPQDLVLSRDYTYDETRVLGKDAESEIMRKALADDLVGLVTRQLSAVR